MSFRYVFIWTIALVALTPALAQPPLLQQDRQAPLRLQPWQAPSTATTNSASSSSTQSNPAATNQLNSNNAINSGGIAPTTIGGQPLTKTQFSSGNGELPRKHGQVFREYDIRPYTSRVKEPSNPEQAIIDWILRETGTDVWFSEPVALLSANRDVLRVYHTPQMQTVVQETVDRFVSSQAQEHIIGLRLITIGNPNWRSSAVELIHPVNVQTPGIEAWLLSKENAALLLAQLRKRSDFQEHNAPNIALHNGQSNSISRRQPRSFVRNVRPSGTTWGGYDLEMGQLDEGFSLVLSPLFSLDGKTIDAVIKCDVDQVERFVSVPIDVPSGLGQQQRVQLQVPQLVSWRMHERFRWPADQVLLLSCGVVAMPAPQRAGMLGIRVNINNEPGRADALLFIENKGKAEHLLIDGGRTAGSVNYQGRY